jgi:hypothetical protein
MIWIRKPSKEEGSHTSLRLKNKLTLKFDMGNKNLSMGLVDENEWKSL